MKINEIELSNWRQHRKLNIEVKGNLIGIVGANGSGKSNLLKGIQYCLVGDVPGLTKDRLTSWGETDGYYIISDLFSIPNLRIKAFRYLFSRIKNLFSKSHNADLPLREKVIYLIYAVLTPIVAVSLLLIPAIVFLEDKLRRLPVSLSIFLLFLFLTIFFERVIKKAVHWYVRSRITTINLKK